MSFYVVDASVAAKWFLNEVHSPAALGILKDGNELHAPDFFLLEMDSLFCKRIRRGDISEIDGNDARSILASLPITRHSSETLRETAYAIANQTGCSLYDCLYVTLAVLLETRMVTADRRLCRRLADNPLAGYVLWVEDA